MYRGDPHATKLSQLDYFQSNAHYNIIDYNKF